MVYKVCFYLEFIPYTIIPNFYGRLLKNSIETAMNNILKEEGFCNFNNCYNCKINNNCPRGFLFRTVNSYFGISNFAKKIKKIPPPISFKIYYNKSKKFNELIKINNLKFCIIFLDGIKFFDYFIKSIYYLQTKGLGIKEVIKKGYGKFIVKKIEVHGKRVKEYYYPNEIILEKLPLLDIENEVELIFRTPFMVFRKKENYDIKRDFYSFLIRKLRLYFYYYLKEKYYLVRKLNFEIVDINYNSYYYIFKNTKLKAYFPLRMRIKIKDETTKKYISLGSLTNVGKLNIYGYGDYIINNI